jgi:hypothetical protein
VEFFVLKRLRRLGDGVRGKDKGKNKSKNKNKDKDKSKSKSKSKNKNKNKNKNKSKDKNKNKSKSKDKNKNKSKNKGKNKNKNKNKNKFQRAFFVTVSIFSLKSFWSVPERLRRVPFPKVFKRRALAVWDIGRFSFFLLFIGKGFRPSGV